MAIYYLVSEHLVPIYTDVGILKFNSQSSFANNHSFYNEKNLPLPANYRIAQLDVKTTIHVVFFEVDCGHFLIKAPNQVIAYKALRSLDAFFFLNRGYAPDLNRFLPRLLELEHVPKAEWTKDKLLRELRQRNYLSRPDELDELYLGNCVQNSEMRFLGPGVENIYKRRSLVEALNHLGHSQFLFNGFMNSSYYGCHYKYERASVNRHEMRKRYLENRECYELAFLSAFKGIERFFDVNQIKKNDIEKMLNRSELSSITPMTPYKRWHEIFSGHCKTILYKDLIFHFLNLRNGVAAHSNPAPPTSFMISEDNLMEIQLFLRGLCSKSLENIQPRPLPQHAILMHLSTQAI